MSASALSAELWDCARARRDWEEALHHALSIAAPFASVKSKSMLDCALSFPTASVPFPGDGRQRRFAEGDEREKSFRETPKPLKSLKTAKPGFFGRKNFRGLAKYGISLVKRFRFVFASREIVGGGARS